MNAIFAKMIYELEENRDVALVTIIAQEGSSPRGIGAQMLVKSDGSVTGSVGGGAVEKRCQELALQCIQNKNWKIREFALRQNETASIGMVCGGDVTAFVQYAGAAQKEWRELAKKLLTIFAAHQSGWLALHLDGSVPAVIDENGNTVFGQLEGAVPALDRKTYVKTENMFYMPLPVRDRALLFGGGHCTQALAMVLAKVGFRVVVVDNRPEYADPALFPEAESVICGDYCHIADYLTVEPADYVVIMTHGHVHDLDVQEQVLRHPPYYVGVIGSKSKKDFVNSKLRELGIPDEVIATVHSPIGTAIKAVTPEEIAVSIAGEMIYERALLRESCGITFHGCPMHG
ncbi:MAG: XdhC/CoxI family protein [Firmicutes bacterium]|nr:XdhC/CoxI family protein [Bacillota bacterium]